MLLEPIVNTPGSELGNLGALQLLLRAASYHDYSICLLTFDFWYRISEALYMLPVEDFDAKRDLFKPVVAQ